MIQKSFSDFLKDLWKFIKLKYRCTSKRTIIMLDNAATHRTKNVINIMKENFDLVYYLPPYSPQYAPVEHFFSLLKNTISKSCKQKWINLNSEKGRSEISSALQSIVSSFIINCWWHLIKMTTQHFKDLIHHLRD